MLHAQAPQGLGDEFVTGAVEGGVDDLEIVGHTPHGGAVVDLPHDPGEERLVSLGAHQGDKALGDGGIVIQPLNGGKEVQLGHFPGDSIGMVGGELSAVGPVHLIAVVFLGVVAGGDVDAGDAAVFPDGEG